MLANKAATWKVATSCWRRSSIVWAVICHTHSCISRSATIYRNSIPIFSRSRDREVFAKFLPLMVICCWQASTWYIPSAHQISSSYLHPLKIGWESQNSKTTPRAKPHFLWEQFVVRKLVPQVLHPRIKVKFHGFNHSKDKEWVPKFQNQSRDPSHATVDGNLSWQPST